MVLSNFKYRCVLVIKIIAGQGPTGLAEGGWAFGFFFSRFFLSHFRRQPDTDWNTI